ncbi:monovalent cation/H(+) antiporter subunit G [Ornithinimicrobium murale]|uniref:monovalent cation/H(+) antiporter subunit G n=1 Tax=Ornithinimicrobium murale TaxID=1050153 RepID=UPI00192D9401|nr:monovalent cation/H(+) antiporter subunit G [Ornithinimicrobium murale]
MSAIAVIETLQAAGGVLLLAAGITLFGVAAVGLIRLPDAYTRLTAVTKSGTLGLVLVLLGVLVMDPSLASAVKLGLAIVLQLLTAPIGGLALSRGTYRSGAPLPASLQYDELSERRPGME